MRLKNGFIYTRFIIIRHDENSVLSGSRSPADDFRRRESWSEVKNSFRIHPSKLNPNHRQKTKHDCIIASTHENFLFFSLIADRIANGE